MLIWQDTCLPVVSPVTLNIWVLPGWATTVNVTDHGEGVLDTICRLESTSMYDTSDSGASEVTV